MRIQMQSCSNNPTEPRRQLAAVGAAKSNGGGDDRLRLVTGSPPRPRTARFQRERRFAPTSGTAATSIRVVIVAGHTLVRAGYRTILESVERIEVVGEAGEAHDAVRLTADAEPEVALLDLALPGLDDLPAIADFVSHVTCERVAVMVVAPPEEDARVFSALRAGALGVLARDAEPAQLIGAIEVLAGGNALLPTATVRQLVDDLGRRGPHLDRVPERLKDLTDREREVVTLAAEGLTNEEIATQLVISPATAKTHVSRAMVKLRARHRAELVVCAYESGLVRPRAVRGGH
jgi:DNA-binding NarL/FixJ family response regulator